MRSKDRCDWDGQLAHDGVNGMAISLTMDFERRFRRGPSVQGRVELPLEPPIVTVLFGPSGSGKTTILRCLAGLDRPDAGTIVFGEEVWFDARTRAWVGPQGRRVGFLHQEYALFPHLTVRQNVAFGLSGKPGEARDKRVRAILDRTGLSGLSERRPSELSGGQQQRAALARALGPAPRILLLDEPLSALDAPTRDALRTQLRQQLVDLAIPSIVVTHDRIEALSLGDRMIALVDGRIRQVGSVEEVFARPADDEVARSVGVETVVPGRVLEARDGLLTLDVAGRRLTAVEAEGIEGDVLVCIRAEDVVLRLGPPSVESARNRLDCRVRALVREGPLTRVLLDCGFPLAALVTPQSVEELSLWEGREVTAIIKAPAVHCVPRNTRPAPVTEPG
jgi:molybdate transport system ATP-binding protein